MLLSQANVVREVPLPGALRSTIVTRSPLTARQFRDRQAEDAGADDDRVWAAHLGVRAGRPRPALRRQPSSVVDVDLEERLGRDLRALLVPDPGRHRFPERQGPG